MLTILTRLGVGIKLEILIKSMHIIQQKMLNLAKERNLAGLTLRKIGELIGESGSPQKIKHHLDKLLEKGFLLRSVDGEKLKAVSAGLDKAAKLISLPIIGAANCGEALIFADEKIEGYLKVSPHILARGLARRVKNLYVLRAVGISMNRANINDKNINDGDYVLIDKTAIMPNNGDYVISVIDGLSNIKRFYNDQKNNRIILFSESTMDIPPIYIHKSDFADYLIGGRVVDVFKKLDEESLWQDAAGFDAIKDLEPMSREELEYYKNL